MTVADYLNASGVETYLDVPSDRPSEFCVVEQTGGSIDERVGQVASIDVDCWSATRRGAASLSERVAALVSAIPDEVENVFGAEVTDTYRNPDLETSPPTPRVTVGVEITAIV